MKNELVEKAKSIIRDDLNKNKSQLNKGGRSMATALDTEILGLLDGPCGDCYALQILGERKIGCAANTDQIRQIAFDKIEGNLLAGCSMKTDIPDCTTVVKDGNKITYSGSGAFFRSFSGK